MDILLKSVRVVDISSSHHSKTRDILIQNGIISAIGTSIKPKGKVKTLELKDLHVSQGWVDTQVLLHDPGNEQHETVSSCLNAAARGGFTRIFSMPDAQPLIETKAQIDYLKKSAEGFLTSLHPCGSITHASEHKDLAEIYDMAQAGAIAFADCDDFRFQNGILERLLLYIKAFHGIALIHPEDKSITRNGCIHEGEFGTRLGLPLMPPLAEDIALNNLLYLLEVTQSRLHVRAISLKKSVQQIKTAKKKNLNLSCGVNVYNLFNTDKDVNLFDTNFKVNPPLREQSDCKALLKGLADGDIDLISSAHRPWNEDYKKCEFDKAAFGMEGLETAFSVARTATKNDVELTTLINALSNNARKIFNLPSATIAEGNSAELSLFLPDSKVTYSLNDIRSASKNNPYLERELLGKVIAVIHQNKMSTFYEV